MEKTQENDPVLPDRNNQSSAEAAHELPAAAKRALAEAEARRAQVDDFVASLPKEVNGQEGPEPSRYGDWEKDGITSDF